MRKQILCGNWKMNKTMADADAFFGEFGAVAGQTWETCEVMFAVPFTLLHRCDEYRRSADVKFLAQNCHFENNGAFTGEISVLQLKELGICGALVGHSERRQYYNESDISVAQKVAKLHEHQLLAMACVGETQQEREAGQTAAVITRQVEAVLKASTDSSKLVIAYEPVWAIGTGLTATNEQAQEVHALIRSLVDRYTDTLQAQNLRILYGGSAKPANIGGLLEQADIDGGLVGGASLEASGFADMVKIAAS